MAGFKVPTFQERAAAAAHAKNKALEKLRAKPPVDPEVLAERNAARLAREAAEAEKRAEKQRAKEQAEAEKREQAAAAERAKAEAAAAEAAAKLKLVKSIPTEAERKAARDARYAARKARA